MNIMNTPAKSDRVRSPQNYRDPCPCLIELVTRLREAGQTYVEIGEVLGCSDGAVSQYMKAEVAPRALERSAKLALMELNVEESSVAVFTFATRSKSEQENIEAILRLAKLPTHRIIVK